MAPPIKDEETTLYKLGFEIGYKNGRVGLEDENLQLRVDNIGYHRQLNSLTTSNGDLNTQIAIQTTRIVELETQIIDLNLHRCPTPRTSTANSSGLSTIEEVSVENIEVEPASLDERADQAKKIIAEKQKELELIELEKKKEEATAVGSRGNKGKNKVRESYKKK